MIAFGIKSFLCCFMVAFDFVHSQSCTCDLTSEKCDINCCCDVDCSSNDKISFTTCKAVEENNLREVCVSDTLLFSANGEYQASGNGGGLFCVYKDNYQERNFYADVSVGSSTKEFDALVSKYQKTSYSPGEQIVENYQSSFKYGDPLFVLRSNNIQGFLVQPLNGELCSLANAARFLHSNTSTCVQQVKSIANQCSNDASWNALNYVQGFKVAPYPSFIIGMSDGMSQNSSNELISPILKLPLKCKGSDVKNCSFSDISEPKLLSSGVCSNVLSKISYDITYSTNITIKISRVEVSVELANVSNSFTSFLQTYEYSFHSSLNLSSTSNISLKTSFERSGNPGYLIDYPLIVGNVIPNNISGEVDVSTLTTIKPTTSSKCEDASVNRLPVKFGIDFHAACFVSIQKNMSESDCVRLQDQIYSHLLNNLPSHVGSFGSLDGSTTAGWIAIINNKPTSEPASSNGECQNMVMSVSFEILYAKTGFFGNPQRKVVGFQVKYGTARSLFVGCNGLLCSPSHQQKFVVTQSIAFIDVSSTPQAEVRPLPSFAVKAPNDFLYPFF